ncbi:MAG: tetratricopeptide repeat protein [Pseudomonadota bacterium]
MRGFFAALVVGLAMGLATAPASAQSWTGTGETVEDLRYRLGILDAELADIRARIQALGGGAGGGGASVGSAISGDAVVRLDRLEVELRRLTGALEELQFQQRQMAEDAGRRLGDIEFRLTELEGGDVSALGAPQPLGGATSGQSFTATPTTPAPTTPSVPSSAQDTDLALAVADIQQGRFDQGEGRLQQILSDAPNASRAAEAQFWLGRSNFVRGSFAEAARRHLAGYNAERQGAMASRNLLQLGVSLGRLGQLSEACLTLREVRSQFPAAAREVLNAADAESDRLACAP